MKIIVNRDRDDLIKFIETRADRLGLQCKVNDTNILIEAKPGDSKETQTPIPVCFKGKIIAEKDGTEIKGRFSNGFYLSTLLYVAIILIGVRLVASVYQQQMDNIILCGIVTVLLVVVYLVADVKGKPLRNKIAEMLNNLDKKK